jgi:16S rRNA (cytosine1402-N4)-methyltransferase
MRFDTNQELSAYEVIQDYKEEKLSKVFQNYADFSTEKADEIAKKIQSEKRKKPIESTHQLKEILNQCHLGEKACVVIFQAIRIEVNQEMKNLETFLSKIPAYLKQNGRCAIMSYHSIEDRIVKIAFKKLVAD